MSKVSFASDCLQLADTLTTLRRDFHAYPELSYEEHRTAGKIADILHDLGYEVTTGVAQTGVTAFLKGGKPGPTIALRGDIDGLPVTELNDLPYKSKNEGKMHACGHDIHITSVLGAAMLLAKVKDELAGNVFLIFQPAEEINRGAKDMVAEGVMSNPKVDMIFGLHNHPDIPVGQIGIKTGGLMAAVDTTHFKITGEGSHGGYPHRSKDPILATAAMIMNVQSIVGRNVPPLDAAVISFGTIKGGTANNVIPDFVELSGTVRSYLPAVQDLLEKRLREVVEQTAATFGCKGELEYRRDLPPVLADEKAYEIALGAVKKIAGENGAVVPTPSMGGEDFAIFMEKAPGCFMWLGVGNPAMDAIHPWHSPHFKADDAALPYGAGVLAQAAVDAMFALAES